MRWNKKYNYPSSSRAIESGIRRYLLGDKKLPGVTSRLEATRSEEDKAALANWRERTGHKEAEAITKAASSRGSKMHGFLESYLLNRENLSFFEEKEQFKMMAKQIIDKGLKDRLDEMINLQRKHTLELNMKKVGNFEQVLIEKESKKSTNHWAGRTDSNEWVIVEKNHSKIKDIIPVEITEATGVILRGKEIIGA